MWHEFKICDIAEINERGRVDIFRNYAIENVGVKQFRLMKNRYVIVFVDDEILYCNEQPFKKSVDGNWGIRVDDTSVYYMRRFD